MRGVEKAVRKAAVFIGVLLAIGGSSTASAGALCDAGALFTQDPNVCVYLSAPSTVDYSVTGAPTYLTVSVKIENKTTNDLNRVKINGKLSPTSRSLVNPLTGDKIDLAGGDPVALATGSVSISCVVSRDASGYQMVNCGGTTGISLRPGENVSFKLLADTPDITGKDTTILFDLQALFAEGGSTSDTSNTGTATGYTTTTVTAPSGDSAAASFPAVGGTLSTTPDTFTTKVKIPATSQSTSATITETASTSTSCKNFKTCYTTEISIPGLVTTSTDPLKIELFVAASNIKNGVKIENVSIYYTYQDSSLNNLTVKVSPCNVGDQANGDGIPCLNKYVNYKNSKTIPSWTAPIGFGFYWQLLNTHNGSFTID